MGAPPQEEEEPTDAQLAAPYHRVAVQKQPPYVDFSVWLPFGRRVKFQTFMLVGDGSFVMKELPGPQNLQQWMVRVEGVQGGLHLFEHCLFGSASTL